MTFRDLIKNSILEGFVSSDLSTTTIVTTLGVSALLGLFIYTIYRITSKSGFYNRGFNKSLVVLPIVTTGILLAMQSNLVISLGMVGALSIVRYRNAVKDPMDLVFLFWSISVGIVVGARLFELAVLLSLGVTVAIVGLDMLPSIRMPYLLVVSGEKETDETVLISCIRAFSPRAKIRSRNITKRGTEWIVELQVKDTAGLVKRVFECDGVLSVNLLSHDGEVRF